MPKVEVFRRNAEVCEAGAASASHPEIQRRWLDLAKEWRDMADRFEPLARRRVKRRARVRRSTRA